MRSSHHNRYPVDDDKKKKNLLCSLNETTR